MSEQSKQRACEQAAWMNGSCCVNADLEKDFGYDLMTVGEYMIFKHALNAYGKSFAEYEAADEANQIIQRLMKRDK